MVYPYILFYLYLGVFIKNLEDETKNGLVEIESLLTDMEYHIPAHIHKHTILEASTSDKSKKR